MADILLNGGDVDDGSTFVYTGGRAPHNVRRAKIDESIDTILAFAFFHCTQLIEVKGHDKLKKIEGKAFSQCQRIRRLTKMNGVIEIEANAFNGCSALSDVDFDKLEIIGFAAFSNCTSLRSINLPSVRRVGDCAFYNCWALTDAAFGEDLERISDAFWNSSLRRIAIPLKRSLINDQIASTTGGAFNYCLNLSRVDIVGGIHKTISSLHMKGWRDDMQEEIESINQTLPNTYPHQKTTAIQQWIRSVLNRMEHYKSEHKVLVKEAMTLLELALWKANLDESESTGVPSQEGVRVTRRQIKRARKERCITSGASIIIKNVLPFLALK